MKDFEKLNEKFQRSLEFPTAMASILEKIQNRIYQQNNKAVTQIELGQIISEISEVNNDKRKDFLRNAPKELVSVSDVNIRKTPRSNGKIIAVLKEAVSVMVLEDLAKYYLITYFDESDKIQVIGFVSKSYLKSK